jgi:uncharacterized membrane protein
MPMLGVHKALVRTKLRCASFAPHSLVVRPHSTTPKVTIMIVTVTRFILLLLLSLLVGTMFCIWVGFNPASLSASAYVEQQQNAIHAFNTLLPTIGAVCILLTAGLAYGAHSDLRVRYLHAAAAICLVVAAVVTRFGNQPINTVVMTWTAQAPAVNWTELRDAWWQWHIVRSVAGIGALVLTFMAVLTSKRAPM